MNRKQNLINNIILLVLTVAAVFAVTLVGNNKFSVDLWKIILVFLGGAIVAGIVNTLVHEFGHVIGGKKNGFKFVAMRIFCFNFVRLGKKTAVEICRLKEEIGSTEMLPVGTENLGERFAKMTRAGLYGTAALLVLSVLPLAMISLFGYNHWWAYALTSVFFPVSVYFFFANALPMTNEGLRNDAAVVAGIKKGDDVSKVTLGLLKIHAELDAGKSPAEIADEEYDLPQLPEDDPNFIILLNNRYAHEVDKGDFEAAKKTSLRLEELLDDMPKPFRDPVRADLLYNACTFDFNENKADNLVEDAERYLNGVNSFTNLRIKAAYLLYVVKDEATAAEFIEKAVRDAEKCRVEGIKKYELKLLSLLSASLPQKTE